MKLQRLADGWNLGVKRLEIGDRILVEGKQAILYGRGNGELVVRVQGGLARVDIPISALTEADVRLVF